MRRISNDSPFTTHVSGLMTLLTWAMGDPMGVVWDKLFEVKVSAFLQSL